jgi:hypothetical protein
MSHSKTGLDSPVSPLSRALSICWSPSLCLGDAGKTLLLPSAVDTLDEQKHSQAIVGGHLKHQMIFPLAFELIQQIFIGCGKQFTRHRIHRCWRQVAGVNEA